MAANRIADCFLALVRDSPRVRRDGHVNFRVLYVLIPYIAIVDADG